MHVAKHELFFYQPTVNEQCIQRVKCQIKPIISAETCDRKICLSIIMLDIRHFSSND